MSVLITNFSDGSTICYSLPILCGEVRPSLCNVVEIFNTRSGKCMSWPIIRGRFKALVELLEGENIIHLRYLEELQTFCLTYKIPSKRKFVRCVYIVCANDENNGHFQAPPGEDASSESAAQRIAFSSKLLQSFTAEKLHEHNFGRKTFALENDMDSTKPGCYVYRSTLDVSKAQSMSAHDLWTHFAKELMVSKSFAKKGDCKWLVFMSFTRYVSPSGQLPRDHLETLQYTKGHAALGGGGLALFGSGNMHCWASNVNEFLARFTDSRKIDKSKLMDDSAYREFYWANYATGLGASLHELGHTFDLCHTSTGIMARGFDDIHRTFVLHHSAMSDSSSAVSSASSSCSSSTASSPSPYQTRFSPFCGDDSRFEMPQSLSRPHDLSVKQVETAFQMLSPLSTQQVQVVRNYDGSETKRTTKRNRNGTESTSEVTVYGQETVVRETLRHEATGRSKMILSVSFVQSSDLKVKDTTSLTVCTDADQLSSKVEIEQQTQTTPVKVAHQATPVQGNQEIAPVPGVMKRNSGTPLHSNNGVRSAIGCHSQSSSISGTLLPATYTRFRDGGAHWHRSSAVLLAGHRWFNEWPSSTDSKTMPTVDGLTVTAEAGLWLVEVRSVGESTLCHHWEFHSQPPLQCYELTRAASYSNGADEVIILVEDICGNVVKKKISLKSALKTAAGSLPK